VKRASSIARAFLPMAATRSASVDSSMSASASAWAWPGGLHYGDVWFIPAILGAAGVLIVAVDLGMMARGTRA
jgi:hypothetical protein